MPSLGAMDGVSGLLVDIDGVLVVSWAPIPGAPEALADLRRRGVPMRFATNTTSRTRAEIARLLTDAGMAVEPQEILTAPVATAAHLRAAHPGARCLLVNQGDIADDLEGIDVVTEGAADVVVFGGAGPAFGYEALSHAFSLVDGGAPLVAMHRNLAWMTADGMRLDTGAFLPGIEEAAGVTATVVGKPDPAFFHAGAAAMGLDPAAVAMVGDDVVNDVLGAQAAGMHGVLVRTGKFDPRTLDGLDPAPELVVDSFAVVPGLLGGE